MKTDRILSGNLQWPQDETRPLPPEPPSPAVPAKRKRKTEQISAEIIAYYANLLKEHNRFIRENSVTVYRIL